MILALGSVNHFFAMPGAEANCFTLKSMEEGIALRNHILRCIETASQMAAESVEARQQLLTFVIIGGPHWRRVRRRAGGTALSAAGQRLS